MEYKTLITKEKVDLIPYVKEYITNKPDTVILIGCDSQNQKHDTLYAIVIGLYTPGKGAHVLFTKFNIPRERDNFTRLFKEVQHSVELAEQIREGTGVRAKYIDVDINNDKKYKSNTVLASAIGYVTSFGYNFRHKHDTETPYMCYAADSLIK
jgi:predicted RNase H-related nuclease YkuK (DUF458 family)